MGFLGRRAYDCLQGFSRIYLGVHDPGDVAGGLFFGVACLAAYIVERHQKSSARLGALSGFQMLGCCSPCILYM